MKLHPKLFDTPLTRHIGLDGVIILWDTLTGECLFKISDAFGGAISTLVWIEGPNADERYPNFCYGNASGQIVLCGYVETRVSFFRTNL